MGSSANLVCISISERYAGDGDKVEGKMFFRARFMTGGGYRLLASGQTLEGSFSAVSKCLDFSIRSQIFTCRILLLSFEILKFVF